jgi:putative transposase
VGNAQCGAGPTGPHPSRASTRAECGEARGVAKRVYKQTNGRKRHIVVDTLGLLLMVVVHSASVQEAAGGQLVLQAWFDRIKKSVHNRWCRLKLIWVDCAYVALIETARWQFGWRLEIVSRLAGAKGFQVLAHRWVVERTFGWFGRYRRLARDYEHTVPSSEAMVYLASIRRRLKLVVE